MKYVYIDYENLNAIEKLIKIDGKYFFFIGENQAKINSSLVYSTNGMDITWVKIAGSGKNSLDFHIAYYLGKNDSDKSVEHLILSKDTGFDPLIKHLKSKGIKARRIEALKDISNKEVKVVKVKNQKNKKAKPSNYEKAISGLKKMRQNGKPSSMKALKSYTNSQVKGLSEEEITNVIDEMLENKIVSVDENDNLKYSI